jgi:AraC-like DNA-binding protein
MTEAKNRALHPDEVAPDALHDHARTPGQRRGATARIGTAIAIPIVLRRLGVDPAEVLSALDLDPKLFADPDNVISLAMRGRLLDQCANRTGCRHFGLLLGQEEGLPNLGAIGYFAQNNPDVRTALDSICRYMHLQAQAVAVELSIEGSLAVFSYAIYEPLAEGVDQTCDAAVAIMCNIMRALCGAGWKPARVLFAHRPPADIGPFREFFRAPLSFNAERNGLIFSADWLGRELPRSDGELRRLMQKQIASLEAEHGDDLAGQVTRLLRTALLIGQGSEEHIARALDMNPRSLRRRLRESGIQFRELSEHGRFEIARQFLETSDMDVASIAAALEYANRSAFTRAFRRWSGTTPARWRAERQRRA